MEIILEKSFLDSAERLPEQIKKKLAYSVKLLELKVYHPLLHTKELGGNLSGLYSFRITRDYRVIFYFENPQIIHLLKALHRKDSYR